MEGIPASTHNSIKYLASALIQVCLPIIMLRQVTSKLNNHQWITCTRTTTHLLTGLRLATHLACIMAHTAIHMLVKRPTPQETYPPSPALCNRASKTL